MTDVLRERGIFDRSPFVLIDVGCSGGIDDAWRAFGRSLVVHGYDPNIEACEEAQAREPFPHVHYHPRFIGLPESHPIVKQQRVEATRWVDTNPWERVSAGHLSRAPQHQTHAAGPTICRSTLLGVDEIVRTEELATVDFLKVDVDGPDLDVLESARDVLADARVLGVGMEVNWYGSPNPTEHTFHNTDLFLRQQGYSLFGVTVRRYSRIDLPAPFCSHQYAQTTYGQPYQGDAIYIRDLAASYHRDLADELAADKLLKLACIYELFGLPDCAAEVINCFHSRLRGFGETEPLLDALTPPLRGKRLTYREYISKFEKEPNVFLPSNVATAKGLFWDLAYRIRRRLSLPV